MQTIYIASNTSGDDNAPGYVSIVLDRPCVKRLLAYRDLLPRLIEADSNFYCIEFFDYSATFGYDTAKGFAEVEIGDAWVEVPDATVVDATDDSLTANTIKITRSGVLWCACMKFDGATIESEELSWTCIDRVNAGVNPFASATIA